MPLESIAAGPWSLVPPLVTIALAWYTRDALICAGGSVVLFVVFGVFLLDGFQLLPY